ITAYASQCNYGGCYDPVQVRSWAYAVLLYDRGFFSSAVYDRTIFEVADTGVSGQFQPASVTSVTLAGVPAGTNPVFQAQGWGIHNGQPSRPNLEPIVGNQAFAIYEDDIYNPDNLFEDLTQGVDKPSGLRWPHIAGTRNGWPFWYTTTLPTLVRD